MDGKRTSARKLLGVLTADQIGEKITVTLPTTANISAGAQIAAYLDADGTVILRPQPEHINIWDTEFVQNYDFERDKAIIGTPDDMGKVGKEI